MSESTSLTFLYFLLLLLFCNYVKSARYQLHSSSQWLLQLELGTLSNFECFSNLIFMEQHFAYTPWQILKHASFYVSILVRNFSRLLNFYIELLEVLIRDHNSKRPFHLKQVNSDNLYGKEGATFTKTLSVTILPLFFATLLMLFMEQHRSQANT